MYHIFSETIKNKAVTKISLQIIYLNLVFIFCKSILV